MDMDKIRMMKDISSKLQRVTGKGNVQMFGGTTAGGTTFDGLKKLKVEREQVAQEVFDNLLILRKTQIEVIEYTNKYDDVLNKWVSGISDTVDNSTTPPTIIKTAAQNKQEVKAIRTAEYNNVKLAYQKAKSDYDAAPTPKSTAVVNAWTAAQNAFNTSPEKLAFDARIAALPTIIRNQLDNSFESTTLNFYEQLNIAKANTATAQAKVDASIAAAAVNMNKWRNLTPELKVMLDTKDELVNGVLKFLFDKAKPVGLALDKKEIQEVDVYYIMGRVAKKFKDTVEGSTRTTQKELMKLLTMKNWDDSKKLRHTQVTRALQGFWQWLLGGFFEAIGITEFINKYNNNAYIKKHKENVKADKDAAKEIVKALSDDVTAEINELKSLNSSKKDILQARAEQVKPFAGEIHEVKNSSGHTIKQLADSAYYPGIAPTDDITIRYQPPLSP